jgi:hypothetical protein
MNAAEFVLEWKTSSEYARNSKGVTEHKQKQLMLCNLDELYEKVLRSHPDSNNEIF